MALLLVVPLAASGAARPDDDIGLKLVITVEQQTLIEPYPARVTLHLHNSSNKTFWLYHPVRGEKPDAKMNAADSSQAISTTSPLPADGPYLGVSLQGVKNEAEVLGKGVALDPAGMPHPKLIRLAPGEDDEVKTEIQLQPAQVGIGEALTPVWGKYRLTVTFRAEYSNGDDLERILGMDLWQGKVESNSVLIDLQPATASAAGSISGKVTNTGNLALDGILVSLSDREEHLLNQKLTNVEGIFSFPQLPVGMYWVTIRRREANEDTVVFRHADVTQAQPAGTIDFLLTAKEAYEPKQMLHKPVLIEVVDGAGSPLDNVNLICIWSSGTVLDNVKGVTASDGIAAMELIPGTNYLTLKRRGCPKDDERINVANGPGIDGFKMVFDCSKR